MAEKTSLMKIGQLSRETGKTARTLHFYEDLGLLTPDSRTRGGFRLYATNAIVRVRWISRMQDLGFSLQEIAAFLRDINGHEAGPDAMLRLSRCYEQKVLETRAAVRRLQALEQELVDSLTYLEGCLQCDPQMQRSECTTCDDENHTVPAPAMVVAVRESI